MSGNVERLDCFSESPEGSKQKKISEELEAVLAPLMCKHIDNLDYTLSSLTDAFKTIKDDDEELNFQVRCATANIEQSFRDWVGEANTAIQHENGNTFTDFEEQVEQLKRNNGNFLLAIKQITDSLDKIPETKPKRDKEEDAPENPELVPEPATADVELEAELEAKQEEIEKLTAELAHEKSQKSTDTQDTAEHLRLQTELKARQEEIEKLTAELALEKSQRSTDAQDAAEHLRLQDELTQLQTAQLEKYEQDIRTYKERYRAMVEELATAKGNIRIICRIKPETDAPEEDLIKFTNLKGDHPFLPWSALRMSYLNDSNRTEIRDFEFQRIFGASESNQEIFNEVKEFAQTALSGNACTIMAYGATGTGKSHTFLSEDGLVNRYIGSVFDLADEDRDEYEYEFYLSAVEIYMNKIFDLLQPYEKGQKIEVPLGTETNVKLDSQQEAVELIQRTVDRRETASTKQNESSSRSHFILSLRIERKTVADGGKAPTMGFITFLDEAGSERIGKNLSSGTPSPQEALIFNQGKDINESLLDLGKSIRSVATGGKFFPGHNLTRFLRSSLVQGSRLLVVGTVSPLIANRNDTLSTLRWCQEAVGSTVGKASTRGDSEKQTPSSSRLPVRSPSSRSLSSTESPTPTRASRTPSRGRGKRAA